MSRTSCGLTFGGLLVLVGACSSTPPTPSKFEDVTADITYDTLGCADGVDPAVKCDAPFDTNTFLCVVDGGRVTWNDRNKATTSKSQITYPHGNPCKSRGPKECKVQRHHFPFPALVKYDVEGTAGDTTCKPLDPYIIVVPR